jgi:hypothetical protein
MLVPTNFSDTSQAVIRYLLLWMNAVGGELVLLHVVPEILSRWSDVMELRRDSKAMSCRCTI